MLTSFLSLLAFCPVRSSQPHILDNPDAWNTQIRSQVNLEEWFIYFEVVLGNQNYKEEVLALSDAIFTVIDADESGHLNKSEWADLFRVYDISVIYVDETFSKIDVNGDGSLRKDEVMSMIYEFYYSDDPQSIGSYMFGPI